MARGHLVRLLDECEDNLAEAIADVARLQPYARWWMRVTDHIEHGGMDPVAALTAARTAARQTLLLRSNPRTACPFEHGEAVAALEATRRFYNDTATLDLDAITRPGPATPTLIHTLTAGRPPVPQAGPTAGSMPPNTGRRPR
jgi:hypothetical protein